MDKAKKNTLIIVVYVLLGFMAPVILVLGFYYGICFFLKYVLDINGRKYLKYMINYMDAIPVTCTEYKLADWDDSKYSSLTKGISKTITIDGIENEVNIEKNDDKDLTLTVADITININTEFMAERSPEYVTISEVWYRYDDNMDNYEDYMPEYIVEIFDNNIFVTTDYRRGGGAWWFTYYHSMPACLFKYDIENDTVLYAGYLIRDYMTGEYQIERAE